MRNNKSENGFVGRFFVRLLVLGLSTGGGVERNRGRAADAWVNWGFLVGWKCWER